MNLSGPNKTKVIMSSRGSRRWSAADKEGERRRALAEKEALYALAVEQVKRENKGRHIG